ncbi:PAS domain-containing protein [Dongia soli]|uniref:PAS domain-containing protein n=1 Tax=Dongia soli TaxID=600628 RepID=UPI003606562D
MFNCWAGKKHDDRIVPSRSEIDPADFTRILPRVMIADVIPEPLDFRYRLSGTGICNVHGEVLTYRHVRDLPPPQYGALVYDHYARAVSRKQPLLHLISNRSTRSVFTHA